MEDILIMKRCNSCSKHLTLRESVRTGEESGRGVFVVEYCSFCGAHPITEIVQVAEVMDMEVKESPGIEDIEYEDGE